MLNFKISELIASDTAIKYNINNMPDINSLDNMLILIVECLQPVRDLIKKPIIVSSGYRCQTLNKKVGGVATSQHCKGEACDINATGLTPYQLYMKIINSSIEYDQCILEPSWVHISYSKGKNRKQHFVKS